MPLPLAIVVGLTVYSYVLGPAVSERRALSCAVARHYQIVRPFGLGQLLTLTRIGSCGRLPKKPDTAVASWPHFAKRCQSVR
jgi:hypothetical protein